MNDVPLPGRKRAVLIFISFLILMSFGMLCLNDPGDEDYLSGDEELCFGVKKVPSNMLKVFFERRISFHNAMPSFAGAGSERFLSEDISEIFRGNDKAASCNSYNILFNLRC